MADDPFSEDQIVHLAANWAVAAAYKLLSSRVSSGALVDESALREIETAALMEAAAALRVRGVSSPAGQAAISEGLTVVRKLFDEFRAARA
ncbi:MAG: hypothetical protein C3F11_12530 [Methylocystaceae bacterium]|nr:MAG: hypothetical protein C3F11_12530 [Methylocystaceae bacterium]